jgi:hypothetical protein
MARQQAQSIVCSFTPNESFYDHCVVGPPSQHPPPDVPYIGERTGPALTQRQIAFRMTLAILKEPILVANILNHAEPDRARPIPAFYTYFILKRLLITRFGIVLRNDSEKNSPMRMYYDLPTALASYLQEYEPLRINLDAMRFFSDYTCEVHNQRPQLVLNSEMPYQNPAAMHWIRTRSHDMCIHCIRRYSTLVDTDEMEKLRRKRLGLPPRPKKINKYRRAKLVRHSIVNKSFTHTTRRRQLDLMMRTRGVIKLFSRSTAP